jgi:hypothetical protein
MKHKLWLCMVAFALAGCGQDRMDARTTQVIADDPGGMERPAIAASGGSPTGFANLPDRGDLVEYPSRRVVRRIGGAVWHQLKVSEAHAFHAMAGRALDVRMPDGRILSYDYDRHVEHDNGDWTWVGHAANGSPGDQTILTFGSHATFGQIARPGESAVQVTTRGGASWLVESAPGGAGIRTPVGQHPDFSIPVDDGVGEAPPPASELILPLGQSTSALVAKAAGAAIGVQPVVVDVLAAWDNGFLSAAGTQEAAQTRINYLLDVANQALINSGLNVTLRLVTGYYPPSIGVTMVGQSNQYWLERISSFKEGVGKLDPDPAFNHLRFLRELYGADLVAVFRDYQIQNDGCGAAWLIGRGQTELSALDEKFGYAVISDGEASSGGVTYRCADETLVHELAHTMGAAHDVEAAKGGDGTLDADDYGRFPYSFGYKTGNGPGDFHTIMAGPAVETVPTSPPGDGVSSNESVPPAQTGYRIFSNPRSTFCGGAACGVEGSADNARTIEQVAPQVARFQATIGSAGVQPRLKGDVDGDGRTDLLWFKSGSLDTWFMDGYEVRSTWHYSASPVFLAPYITSAWSNALGADIVWRTTSGAVTYWVGGYPGWNNSSLQYPMSFGWRLLASGVMDPDGRPGLIWRSGVDGRVVTWHLDFLGSILDYHAYEMDPDFVMQTTGDYNADGWVDIMFRRASDGMTVVWSGNGAGFTASSANPALDASWRAYYSGDYDWDGDADIVWQNSLDKRVMVWVMQDGVLDHTVEFPGETDRALVTGGDFNDDGLLDLLWRRADGTTSMWLSLPETSFRRRYVGNRGTEWQLVVGGL